MKHGSRQKTRFDFCLDPCFIRVHPWLFFCPYHVLNHLSRGATPMTPLQSLVACGTKLWLDSVDPTEIAANRANGATGATSNPIIIGDLIATGRFDSDLQQLLKAGHNDE